MLPDGVSLADLGRYSRVIIRFESALTCCVVLLLPNAEPEGLLMMLWTAPTQL